MTAAIKPFALSIEQEALDDLHRRLDNARWPETETVAGWRQGVPLANLKALCDYWHHQYDWRRCEAQLNALDQFTTELDGLSIHFLHIRSPNPDALPLLLTHGWPGSIIEFLKVLGPLSNPVEYGGSSADAFHLVIPSLPGFGFSGKPDAAGWSVERVANAWIELMARLGYERYVAQGGDWGSAVATAIGIAAPPQCSGIHLNLPIAFPNEEDLKGLTADEAEMLAEAKAFEDQGCGYSRLQATRPQTIGYALTDSAIGQAAWIYEKFHGWTDNEGTPESILSRDEILDNIMLYWLPANAASSARLYWESLDYFKPRTVEIPVGISQFPKEISRASRRWAERSYPNLIHWKELDRGGHFAAFEQPELFVSEMRECFRGLRQ